MKKMSKIFILGICLIMITPVCFAQLISGKAIFTEGEAGPMSLPFYNGYATGLVDVNGDNMPDLFLQGTSRDEKGLYVYYFKRFSKNGVPIFSQGTKLDMPFNAETAQERGVVIESHDKSVISFWGAGKSLNKSNLNKSTLKFADLEKVNIKGLPRGFTDFGVVKLPSNKYLFLFTIREAGKFGATKADPKPIFNAEGFWSYNVSFVGIYGALVSDLDQADIMVKPYTELNQALFSLDGYSLFTHQNAIYLASGSRTGNIYTYQYDMYNDALGIKHYLVNKDGVRLRNPVSNGSTVYFKGSDNNEGLITVGEGGIYFYKNTFKQTSRGDFIFEAPVSVRQERPLLYGGSLVVPNLVDWDSDGKIDIISGTSLGYIYFFKNIGSNQIPQYSEPVALEADGNVIHIQAGYKESIQGPGENRWGYTCPNVIDWNGDGLPDILTGDIRGKYVVYLNEGTKATPKLRAEQTLFYEGLPVYGTWRVRPGVGKLANKMAYIHQDKDDDFHLYWQADAYNLIDGGKLTIGDTLKINGSFFKGYGTVGRAKIEIIDWDGDGIKDLLVGTFVNHSIPDRNMGLPFNLPKYGHKRGATILFLKNTGTEEKPIFDYPKVLKFKNEIISLGLHSCSPTVGSIGDGSSNLLVGIETGNFIYYDRKDLTW